MYLLLAFYLYVVLITPRSVKAIVEVKKNNKYFCEEDSVLIQLNKKGLGGAVDPQYVMFRYDTSSECRAHEVNNETLEISFSLTDNCGSEVKKIRGQTQYLNEVIYLDITGITSIKSVLNITCLYVDNKNVPVLPISSSYLQNIDGVNIAEMKLCKGKLCSNEPSLLDGYPIVSVDQFLFVSLLFNVSRQSRVQIRNCYASYYSQPQDVTKAHYFIKNSCIDKLDSTVEILKRSEFEFLWKFQMFKWLNVEIQRIYLFCSISLEDSNTTTSNNNTYITCLPNTNKSLTRESDNELHVVGVGPIFASTSQLLEQQNTGEYTTINNGLQDGNESNVPVYISVGISASIIVFILLSIGIAVWWRQRRQGRKTTGGRNKEERIQPGFAFTLHSSNDANIYKDIS